MPKLSDHEVGYELEEFLKRIIKGPATEGKNLLKVIEQAKKHIRKTPPSSLRTDLLASLSSIQKELTPGWFASLNAVPPTGQEQLKTAWWKFVFLVKVSFDFFEKSPQKSKSAAFYKFAALVKKTFSSLTALIYQKFTSKDKKSSDYVFNFERLKETDLYSLSRFNLLTDGESASFIEQDLLIHCKGALLNCKNTRNRRAIKQLIYHLEYFTDFDFYDINGGGIAILLFDEVKDFSKTNPALKIDHSKKANHKKILSLLLCELLSDGCDATFRTLQQRIVSLYSLALLSGHEQDEVEQYKKSFEKASLKYHYKRYVENFGFSANITNINSDNWAKDLADLLEGKKPKAQHKIITRIDKIISLFLNRETAPGTADDLLTLYFALPYTSAKRQQIKALIVEKLSNLSTAGKKVEFLWLLLQEEVSQHRFNQNIVDLIYQLSGEIDADEQHQVIGWKKVSLQEIIVLHNNYVLKVRKTNLLDRKQTDGIFIYPEKLQSKAATDQRVEAYKRIMSDSSLRNVDVWPHEMNALLTKHAKKFMGKRWLRGKMHRLLAFVFYRNPVPGNIKEFVALYENLPTKVANKKLLARYLVQNFHQLASDDKIKFIRKLQREQIRGKQVDGRISVLITQAVDAGISYDYVVNGICLKQLLELQESWVASKRPGKISKKEFSTNHKSNTLLVEQTRQVDFMTVGMLDNTFNERRAVGKTKDVLKTIATSRTKKIDDGAIKVAKIIKSIITRCKERLFIADGAQIDVLPASLRANIEALGTMGAGASSSGVRQVVSVTPDILDQIEAKKDNLQASMPKNKFDLLFEQVKLARVFLARQKKSPKKEKQQVFLEAGVKSFCLHLYAARNYHAGVTPEKVGLAGSLLQTKFFAALLAAVGNGVYRRLLPEQHSEVKAARESTITETDEELLSEQFMLYLLAEPRFRSQLEKLEDKQIEIFIRYLYEKTLRGLEEKNYQKSPSTIDEAVRRLVAAALDEPSEQIAKELQELLSEELADFVKMAGTNASTPEVLLNKAFPTRSVRPAWETSLDPESSLLNTAKSAGILQTEQERQARSLVRRAVPKRINKRRKGGKLPTVPMPNFSETEQDGSVVTDELFLCMVKLAEIVKTEQAFVNDVKLLRDVITTVAQGLLGDNADDSGEDEELARIFKSLGFLLSPFEFDVFDGFKPAALEAHCASTGDRGVAYKALKSSIEQDTKKVLEKFQQDLFKFQQILFSEEFKECRATNMLLYNQSLGQSAQDPKSIMAYLATPIIKDSKVEIQMTKPDLDGWKAANKNTKNILCFCQKSKWTILATNAKGSWEQKDVQRGTSLYNLLTMKGDASARIPQILPAAASFLGRTLEARINSELVRRKIALDANAYFIKPTQRFPKYKTFLDDIVKAYKKMFPQTARLDALCGQFELLSNDIIKGSKLGEVSLWGNSGVRASVKFVKPVFSNDEHGSPLPSSSSLTHD